MNCCSSDIIYSYSEPSALLQLRYPTWKLLLSMHRKNKKWSVVTYWARWALKEGGHILRGPAIDASLSLSILIGPCQRRDNSRPIVSLVIYFHMALLISILGAENKGGHNKGTHRGG